MKKNDRVTVSPVGFVVSRALMYVCARYILLLICASWW